MENEETTTSLKTPCEDTQKQNPSNHLNCFNKNDEAKSKN